MKVTDPTLQIVVYRTKIRMMEKAAERVQTQAERLIIGQPNSYADEDFNRLILALKFEINELLKAARS